METECYKGARVLDLDSRPRNHELTRVNRAVGAEEAQPSESHSRDCGSATLRRKSQRVRGETRRWRKTGVYLRPGVLSPRGCRHPGRDHHTAAGGTRGN